jgi:predicted RNase H-like HicB family nuclease
MKIEMIVEKTKTGYSAYAEKYPVYTVGKSLDELKNKIIEALNLYFEKEGTNITENLGNCVNIINTLYTAGELGNLITIYDNIYGNIGDEGVVGYLITDAFNEIENIIAANPAETADLNTYFSAISAQITKEAGFQIKAGMDIGNTLGNSQTSIQSFVFSLPSYGLETKIGGTAQYLEDAAVISPTVVTTYIGLNSGNVEVGNTAGILPGDVVIDNPYFTNIAVANVVSANILTMTGNTSGTPVPNALLTFVKKPGQTIVATLREGRTTAGLNAAGVGTVTNSVDSTPTTPPPQATLLSSVVSERQAQSQVIY